uniref:Uncharacterized protein n=1 Tax=Arundo donax TaxID=35708 RepID=A0A0A9FFZ0_ARUDO
MNVWPHKKGSGPK